ncbi:ATP-binding protein [Deinococcus hopiensis]|uniref:histidine kinase n=1 Tax=Deinococcus hopiensis KR-140 TaxID=695939 RepID=A0A1W1UX94_9DEIO|nr:ATP-binding protein [Deinococcus hopiensis]SMB85334.1 PAS domain S-box-containing protein [Deinococcus hopiensis KR-140]
MSLRDNVSTTNTASQQDVTASLQERILILEGQLRASENLRVEAQDLFQHAPNVAFILTAEGCILDSNLQACTLLGSSQENLMGRRLSGFLSPTAQTALVRLLKQVFNSSTYQTGELQFLGAEGQVLDVAVEIVPCKGERAIPSCHLTLTNITPFKEAHRTLLDSTASLDRQAQEHAIQLRVMNEEFNEVFTATSRELQDHLARVHNVLGRHRNELMEGQLCPHLDAAKQVLFKSGEVLSSVGQYVQARQLRMRLRSVDLNRVLGEVHKDLQSQLRDRDVHFTSMTLPVVQGDSQALQMILREYLSNALKFTRNREQVRVRIRVEETETAHLIGVEDNGVGFNMRSKDKAFELFGRLHPGETYEGTGLGLAVVKRLCERFGGRAWGEGRVGQGATFWFACPKEPRLLA